MPTTEELAERYDTKVITFVETDGCCSSICNLRDGRLAWTLSDLGRVECYDEDVGSYEWSAFDCGSPDSVLLVPLEPPRLWVTDPGNDRILWLDAGSGRLEGILPVPSIGDSPRSSTGDGKPFSNPRGLAWWQDPLGPGSSEVWLADCGNHRLQAFNPETGGPGRVMGLGLMNFPLDVEVLDNKRLASVCRKGGHIFGPSGELLCRFNWHLMIPNAVTYDSNGGHGILVVTDEYTDRICLFDAATGAHLRTLGSTGIKAGTFASKGLAMWEGEEGRKRRLLVADGMNQRICKVGIRTTWT